MGNRIKEDVLDPASHLARAQAYDSLNGQPLLSGITHEPHGPVSGWTWGNGQPHIRAHGLDGEVQRIESAVAQTYGYDSAGQLTQLHL